MLFISFKKLFLFLRYSIFVFLSFPPFLPVGHSFRGWWKISLEVYDVIYCLNKDLITHFVKYRQDKRYDIETWSIDRVLNQEHFHGKKHAANVHQKLVPNPFLISVNNLKQPSHTSNSFKNKIVSHRIIKKPYKKLTLYFLWNQVPFNGQDFRKQKGPDTSDQSLFRSQKFLYQWV